jgi:putative transcriptional regulator
MSKITIRATADATMVETGAGCHVLRVSEHVQVPGRAPEETPARKERAEQRVEVRRIPRVKTVRRALGLTQEEFAARYDIPVGTLRDWEQGRTQPDRPARAYIKVIASNPEWVSQALAAEPQ